MNLSEQTHGIEIGRSYVGGMMTKGKVGEQVVLSWLRARPHVLEVDDLRDLRPMQKADVDACIFTRDGLNALCEIKLDRHLGQGGNVLFEIMRVNHTASPDRACTLGWSMRSPATWLLYYAPKESSVYVFRFAAFRSAFQKWTDEKRRAESGGNAQIGAFNMRWINTDKIKSTLAVLVPLTAFPQGSYTVFDVSEFELESLLAAD